MRATATVAEQAASPLVIQGVTKSFGGLRALDGINLSLNHGERRALIGPNGAGKTTLFHLVTGVHSPSSGKILLFGKDATRMPIHKRAALGVARTFQITNLLPTLTLLENIILSLQAYAPCRFVLHRPVSSFDYLYSQAREILEAWDLWERRNYEVRSLSYGEQRELEIVMALAQRPKLLLLDEPTSGLSPAETASVTKMLRSLPPEVTVLLIEHDMDVAFDLVERMSVLHLGRMVAEGSTDEVRQDKTVQEIYLGSQAQ
ncbi:MAG: ABC transporter ATP-binding protein [Chloroflexi bacterium]|nr:ABC transporter ATP-binding protein [Chloroflexota bacterium]